MGAARGSHGSVGGQAACVTERERVLLDSNILYSAARDSGSSFRILWKIPEMELVYDAHLIPDGEEIDLPATITLHAKDIPNLRSASAGRAHVLLTGDKLHFGPLFGSAICGVRVESTSDFKARYAEYFGSTRGE